MPFSSLYREVGNRTVTYPWWYLPRHSVRVVSAGFLHCLPIPCSVLWSTLLSTVRIQGEGSWALPLDGEGDTFSYIIGNSVRVCPLSPRIDSFTYLHYVSLIYFILWSFFFCSNYPIFGHWELFRVDSWVKSKKPKFFCIFGF